MPIWSLRAVRGADLTVWHVSSTNPDDRSLRLRRKRNERGRDARQA